MGQTVMSTYLTMEGQQIALILENMKKNPLLEWEEFLALETSLLNAIKILEKFGNADFSEPMDVDLNDDFLR